MRNRPEPNREKIMYLVAASVVLPISFIIKIPVEANVHISINTYPVNISFVYTRAIKEALMRPTMTKYILTLLLSISITIS